MNTSVKRRLAATVAAAALTLGTVLVAAPAHALGSNSEKLSASGCTEGDYWKQSQRISIGGVWYIRANTSYTYPICAGGNVVGSRAIGPNTVGSWGYQFRTVSTQVATGTAYPSGGAGNHNVNNAYSRTT